MTFFGEIYFFVWAAVFAVPAFIMGARGKNIKYCGFCVSVFLIFIACWDEPMSIVFMAAYCLWEYGLAVGFIYIRNRCGRKPWIFWVVLILAIAPLSIHKISGLTGSNLLGFMGISYLTFKSVQVIIEIYDGLIDECRAFDFMYFLLFFPCISSGPIDRSRRFQQDTDKALPKDRYMNTVGDGMFKICLGMVYKFVIASLFFQGITYLGQDDVWWSVLIYMYCYGFYLFFDFAGYSLMAVGTGYVFGICVPDNFNKPFISKDIKEFWDRWHITLSHWFRDFVFSRFMMASIRGKWFKSKLTGASVGFMINMTLMGIWHGLSADYILYGVYHGVLLSVTEIYQKKSKFYKRNKKKKWYRALSWFLTFNLVMFGFFIFSGKFLEIVI